MKKCHYCGKFPFCKGIEKNKRECDAFIKRPYTVEIHRRKENEDGHNKFERSERIIR